MISNKQIFLPVIGLSCNSNCIMCSVNSKKRDPDEGTTEQVIKDLIRGRKEGYERMEFTGGEPTVRKDIFDLIRQARNLGYKEIGINTNGILLGDKTFCDKLVKAGLTNVTFSLHAHNKELHEKISRTPNSFEKTIAGIKNAITYKDLLVSVVTVIFRPNYKYIFQIGKFIHSLGITYWNITDLLPEGRAKKNYEVLCVKRTELSDALHALKPLLDDFQSIVFFAFSPCLIPPDILYDKRVTLITAQQKLDVEKPLRYNQKQSLMNPIDDDPNNIHQRKIKICQNCIFSKQCAGIWADYLNLFGGKEIEKLAKKHNCLIV
jgi:cyclic pyranopterin phosphate synthase